MWQCSIGSVVEGEPRRRQLGSRQPLCREVRSRHLWYRQLRSRSLRSL